MCTNTRHVSHYRWGAWQVLQLTNLRTLNLANNRMSALPPELAAMAQMKQLNVEGNGLASLP
jgi:Leucine-rich repeat (LRR) protein